MKSFLPRSLAVIIFAVLSIYAFGQKESIPKCTGPSCDTVGIQHKISPWRIGLFVGPAVAFCGSWESTFNSDKFRDKSLFNGIGFNAAFNADYYFNKSQTSRLKFGLGAVIILVSWLLWDSLFPAKTICGLGGSKQLASEPRWITYSRARRFIPIRERMVDLAQALP